MQPEQQLEPEWPLYEARDYRHIRVDVKASWCACGTLRAILEDERLDGHLERLLRCTDCGCGYLRFVARPEHAASLQVPSAKRS